MLQVRRMNQRWFPESPFPFRALFRKDMVRKGPAPYNLTSARSLKPLSRTTVCLHFRHFLPPSIKMFHNNPTSPTNSASGGPGAIYSSTVFHKFCPWFWQFIMSSNHRNNLKKYEYRNTKQYRNSNFQNSKQKHLDMTISRFGHWYFCHFYLFWVSIFEFRISPSPTDRWNVWIYMNISCCHFKTLTFETGALGGLNVHTKFPSGALI